MTVHVQSPHSHHPGIHHSHCFCCCFVLLFGESRRERAEAGLFLWWRAVEFCLLLRVVCLRVCVSGGSGRGSLVVVAVHSEWLLLKKEHSIEIEFILLIFCAIEISVVSVPQNLSIHHHPPCLHVEYSQQQSWRPPSRMIPGCGRDPPVENPTISVFVGCSSNRADL